MNDGLRATLARSALTCVSLARFSLARFILTRFQFGAFLFGAFHFGAFPNFVRTYGDPVPANASFARTICVHVSFPRRRVVYLFLRACFLSANKCFLRQISHETT